jgi:flagellar protein FlgJ
MQHTIDFIKTYYPHAYLLQETKGYDALAILTQAAVESDWGRKVKGNNFFGIKDTDGKNGNEQEILTTEVMTEAQVKKSYTWFQKIKDWGNGKFTFRVRDSFRKYDSAWESFLDYTKFIEQNRRYIGAVRNKDNGLKYLELVAGAGYATGVGYATLLTDVYKMMSNLKEKHIKI